MDATPIPVPGITKLDQTVAQLQTHYQSLDAEVTALRLASAQQKKKNDAEMLSLAQDLMVKEVQLQEFQDMNIQLRNRILLLEASLTEALTTASANDHGRQRSEHALQDEKNQNQDLKRRIQELSTENRDSQIRLQELGQQVQSLETEQRKEQGHKRRLILRIRNLYSRLWDLRDSEARSAQQNSNLLQALEHHRQKETALMSQIADLKTAVEAESRKWNSEIEKQRLAFATEFRTRQVEFAEKEKTLYDRTQDLAREIEAQKSAHRQELENARKEMENRFQIQKKSIIRRAEEAHGQAAKMKEQLTQAQKTVRDLQDALEQENARNAARLQELDLQKRHLAQELQAAQTRLERQTNDHRGEKFQWEEKTTSLNNIIQAERKVQESLVEQQKKREKQISQFVAFVNQDKEKYQRIIGHLAHEIRQATTLHPLQDCLTATEKELSRVECELKKTPMVSPFRQQLENSVSRLIGQRDDLKELIGKTEKHLMAQSASLERIVRSGILNPVPMPPRT